MTACLYPHGDNRDQHQAENGQLCRPGYLRLEQQIAELPALSGWLHANLAAGGNGGSDIITGTRDKPIPIKVGIHDHLVNVKGTLTSWAEMVAAERTLHGPADNRVNSTAAFLLAHLSWSAEQDWIVDLAEEIHDLTRKAHQLMPSRPQKHRLPAPCPDVECNLLALVRVDGGSYIECEACGRIWLEEEYRRLTVVLSADLKPTTSRRPDRVVAADDGINGRTGYINDREAS